MLCFAIEYMPTRPKGRSTAYAFFQKEYMEIRSKIEGNFPPEKRLTFLKDCNVLWRNLTDRQRQLWYNLEEDDAIRFCRELRDWLVTRPLRRACRRRFRKLTSPRPEDRPKRPMSAFLWWSYDQRANIEHEIPGIKICTRAKLLGERWKTVDAETRLRYELISEMDKRRYQHEMEVYKGIVPKMETASFPKKEEMSEDEDTEASVTTEVVDTDSVDTFSIKSEVPDDN